LEPTIALGAFLVMLVVLAVKVTNCFSNKVDSAIQKNRFERKMQNVHIDMPAKFA
jgi:mannose/fructose/N-acetylgalactosamine-specific phosphotransferase system component IIC